MAYSEKTVAPTGLLTRLYISTVVCVSLLAIAGHALTQHALERQERDATVINIAGRQRMLSQKIAKLSTLARVAQSQAQGIDKSTSPTSWAQARAELRSALALFKSSHEGLKVGDASLALTGNNSATVDV
ncbi:MAG: type IV pili methyl-accepting chemotaxis transducer N-terminal domain-containing protein, partial [Cyanobacteria bacterium J06632_3]